MYLLGPGKYFQLFKLLRYDITWVSPIIYLCGSKKKNQENSRFFFCLISYCSTELPHLQRLRKKTHRNGLIIFIRVKWGDCRGSCSIRNQSRDRSEITIIIFELLLICFFSQEMHSIKKKQFCTEKQLENQTSCESALDPASPTSRMFLFRPDP